MATNTSNFNFQGIGIVNLVGGDSGGPGCMDQNAKNYNPAATEDDDSCLYDEGGPGCTNPNAFNYNPAATIDDDSCVFDPGGSGCTDATAVNYNPTATIDDGTCVWVQIPGCTDPDATNYEEEHNVEDGSCEYLVEIYGCTNFLACNYNPDANRSCDSTAVLNEDCAEVDQCYYPDGCTDPSAPNYDGSAICDDGSCIIDPGGELGCTDIDACNYNPLALNDDNSCDYSCLGCMDDGEKSLANGDDFDSVLPGNSACNYDPFPTINDGSCFWNPCCPSKDYVNFSDSEDCCSSDMRQCGAKKYPGCMDDGQIRYDGVDHFGLICVMDPYRLYDYELPNGTVINADANGIIAQGGTWPGAGNGDDPNFVNQSACHGMIYINNGGGDPSAAGRGSFNPGTPALNYDPFATVDDGSCIYKEEEPDIKGCLDDKACNFDCVYGNTNYPCNDGVTLNVLEVCIYPAFGEDCGGKCKKGFIKAYGDFCPDAKSDFGCCVKAVEGCMDANANNFNCVTGSPSTIPCTDGVNVQDDPSSCIFKDVYGCTDPNADNYDPSATIDDGGCKYTVLGCVDKVACNYDLLANTDDGSCCYGTCGCTDALALNYDATAMCDDGSCYYDVGCSDPNANNYDPSLTLPTDNSTCIYCGDGLCVNINAGIYYDEDGNLVDNPNMSPLHPEYIDSGYVGLSWGDGHSTTSQGYTCPAWDYLVSESLTDKWIGRYYATNSKPYFSYQTTKLCLANPDNFDGEYRVLKHVYTVAIYDYPKIASPQDTTDYIASEVKSWDAEYTDIDAVIAWLNANVHNSFNTNMTYEEVNQNYKDKKPNINWDDSGIHPVYPIRLLSSGIQCCHDC